MMHVASDQHRRAKLQIAFSVAALAIVAFVLLGLGSVPSIAKEKKTMKDGMTACRAWCEKNNKTIASQQKCFRGCETYWACHGSDSTKESCEGVKAAERPSPQLPTGMEDNTDRPGADFGHFEVAKASECQAFCRKDTRCKSWTYVRPRVHGPSAVCYLKNAMPPATPNNCCISGVVPRGPVGVSPNLPPPASQN